MKDQKRDEAEYTLGKELLENGDFEQEEALKPSGSFGIVIVVGAGCLVVIAAVVDILVSRKRKQQA